MEVKNIGHEISEIAKNYDYRQPPDVLIKLQEFVAYLYRLLRDVLSFLKLPQLANSDTRAVADLLQVLVVAAGVAAAVMVLLLVASRMRVIRNQRQLALGSIVVGESPLDSQGWLALGEELAGNASYKEACRAVYMSILHLLDERNIVAFSATKTNYEYFYALKRTGHIAGAFRNLVDCVEYIWFGDKPATKDDYQECRQQAKLIQEGLPVKIAVVAAHSRSI